LPGAAERQISGRAIAAIAVGTLLNPLNSSMIAVALVALQQAFQVGVATSSWLVSGFYLAASVGQPLMGRIADRFGPRRVYCIGLGIVCVTGVVAVSASGFGAILACRIVQAIGTSAAFPSGLAIVRRTTGTSRPPARTLAGIGITNAVSAAFGPVLGGVLVVAFGWRGIFAVNIPLSLLGLFFALRWLPPDGKAEPSPDRKPELAPDGKRGPSRPRRVLEDLDLPGVAMFALVIVGLLGFLLSVGSRTNWPLLAVIPVATAALLWRESRASTPFLDFRTLTRNRGLVGLLGQQIAVQFAFYAIFFGLPMWLERVRHFSGSATGFLMLPIAALGVALTPVAARLVSRRGPRTPLIAGSAALVAGCAALLALSAATPIAGIVVVSAIIGVPNAFNNMALQAALYSTAPADQTGVAAGLFQTCRYIGAILSTALLGIVLEHNLTDAGLHQLVYVTTAVAVILLLTTIVGRRNANGGDRAGQEYPEDLAAHH
jgi:MFS family permease